MNKANVKLRLVTPCISSGADQKMAELRAQSIRGGLHEWFRILGGTQAEEQRIFGRISKKQDEIRRSSLNVRVVIPAKLRTVVKDCKGLTGQDVDYFLWPMRSPRNSPEAGQRGVIDAGEEFELRLSHSRIQGGSFLSSDVVKSYALLGSLGTRSRRCYGSLWPAEISFDDMDWTVPTTASDFKKELGKLLPGKNITVRLWDSCTSWRDAIKSAARIFQSYRCGSPKSGTPTEWGQNDHDTPLKKGETLFRPALGLPLTQRYSSRDIGSWQTSVKGSGQDKANDRWSSPLLLKIIPLDGKYHVLAVFLNEFVLPEGTELIVKGRVGRVNASLSLDLWRELKTEGEEVV